MKKPQHEQDYETVEAHVYEDHVANALQRLHSEAAKVPGLEAQAKADWKACCDVLKWACQHSLNLPPPNRAVTALLERLAKAESERDAARKELLAMSIYLDRVRPVEGLHSVRVASVVGEVENLRERVATLEREKSHLQCEFEAEETRGDEEQRRGDAAEDRADAAEARVKELEARLKDAAQVELSLRNTLAGSLASQPPPAPAQATAPTCGARLHLLNDEPVSPCHLEPGHTEERHAGWVLGSKCTWVGGPVTYEGGDATPTQPALLEAVGKVLKAHASVGRYMGFDGLVESKRDLETAMVDLRTAYDAAKEWRVETLDKALVVEVLRELRWKRPDSMPDGRAENRMLDRITSTLGLTLDVGGGK